jgi:hypothetical protein
MELTLAEGVLLLALDDVKGSTGCTQVDPGLAGALLVDLGRLGALWQEAKKLHPVPAVTITNPALAQAYATILASSRPRSAKEWVGRLPSDLKPISGVVASNLVERGILTEQRSKVLALFPRTRFPEANREPERSLRARLGDVLLGTQAPQEYDALLLGLLDPLGLLEQLVDRPHRRDARQRAKQIAETGIAGNAVSDTVREIHAAVMIAAVVPTFIATAT